MELDFTICFVSILDLGDIRYSKLKERGIKAVVFDKDNTLTAPYQSAWFNARLQDCINDCKTEFGAQNVAICSNTAGTLRDLTKNNYSEAESLQVILDLKVIRHDINKPNTPISDILRHFQSYHSSEILQRDAIQPHEIAIIGDRLVGDVLWGNSLGMLTIKTQPLTLEGENFAVRWVRSIKLELFRLILPLSKTDRYSFALKSILNRRDHSKQW